MYGPLDTGEGKGKWAEVAPLLITGEGAVELWGGVWGEEHVDQGVLDGNFPAEGKQGRGGEYVSGGGILLEVASDDLLDLDAGGMV
eukprot:g14894.t1